MLARVNHAPGTVQIVVANLVAGSQSSPYNFCETLVPAVEPEPDNFFSHPAIPLRKVANAPGRGSFVTSRGPRNWKLHADPPKELVANRRALTHRRREVERAHFVQDQSLLCRRHAKG